MRAGARLGRCAASVATALLALVGAGCATAHRATLPQLQQRAAYDLSCPPQWLELVHIDGRTKVVGGCGRRLVYLEDCAALGDSYECAWRIDSPAGAVVAWGAVPAGPPGQGAQGGAAPTALSAAGRPIATQLFNPGEVPPPAPATVRRDGSGTAPAPPSPLGDPLAMPGSASPPGRNYATDLYGSGTQPVSTPSGRAKPRDLFEVPVPSAPAAPAPR